MRRAVPICLLAILLVAVAWRGVQLFPNSIATGDEALVALRSVGLWEQGHGWTPYWNGAPDIHKPPLYFWLVGIGFKLVGVSETALRLPSLAAYMIVLGFTFWFGKQVSGPWTGFFAALLTALHPTLATQASVGMLDTLMMALTLGAAGALLLAAHQPRYYLGWGICVGLTLLTKGPGAAPILPVTLIYLLTVQRPAFQNKWLYLGAAAALAIAGVWFGSQFHLNRDAFMTPYVIDMVEYRLNHSQSDIWLFLKSSTYLWTSWGGLAPLVIGSFVWIWINPRGRGTSRQWNSLLLLTLIGLVTLLMVSSVRQQMSWYMLPTIPPLAIMTAHVFRRLLAGDGTAWYRLPPCLLLAGGMFLPNVYVGPPLALKLVVSGAVVAAILAAIPGKHIARVGGGLFGLALVLALAGSLSLTNPYVNRLRIRDASDMRQLAKLLPNEFPGPLVVNFRHYPLNALMFYAHRNHLNTTQYAELDIAAGAVSLGVFTGRGYKDLLPANEVEKIAQVGGYDIVKIIRREPPPPSK